MPRPWFAIACLLPGTTAAACPADMVPAGPEYVCIDRYEWPNKKGALPKADASAVPGFNDDGGPHDAETLCAGAGKRTCHRSEWKEACLGPKVSRWPWGDDRAPKSRDTSSACHTGAKWEKPSWGAISKRDNVELRRLYQAEPSGKRSRCVSASGARDMVGNVEEWVACESNPTGYCLAGGYWSGARDCNRVNVTHDARWHSYETGFRCCLDTGPSWRSRVTKLNDVMLEQLATEAKWAAYGTGPKARERQRKVLVLARANVQLGKLGKLVNERADPYVLAAVEWHESRFDTGAAGGEGKWIGAMQVHVGNEPFLARIEPRWKGITKRQLWNPFVNTKAGYDILWDAKARCGREPTIWLTSYRYNQCRSKSDAQGRARWKLAQNLMRKAGVTSASIAVVSSQP